MAYYQAPCSQRLFRKFFLASLKTYLQVGESSRAQSSQTLFLTKAFLTLPSRSWGQTACSMSTQPTAWGSTNRYGYFAHSCFIAFCLWAHRQVFWQLCHQSQHHMCLTGQQQKNGNVWLYQARFRQNTVLIGPQGDYHVGHQSKLAQHALNGACRLQNWPQAWTGYWGRDGAQHAIQNTKPHPGWQDNH